MHPVLLRIPGLGLTLHTYGVMIAIGFLVGMWWASREAVRLGENPAFASDAVFYGLVAGIVGARLNYVLWYDWPHVLADPLSILKIWEGGLVFHGGLIASAIAVAWFVRRIRRSFLRFSDILFSALPLGHAFGRIGCFFAGCCYGRQCPIDAWYAVTFPHTELNIVPTGIPLYPTQLMEAAGNFLIFGALVIISRHQKAAGQTSAAYLILYGLLRFIIETYRHVATQTSLWNTPLSQAQGICVGLMLVGTALWIWCGQRKDATA